MFVLFICSSAHAQISNENFCEEIKKLNSSQSLIIFAGDNWSKQVSVSTNSIKNLGQLFAGMPDKDGDGDPDEIDLNSSNRISYERSHTSYHYYGSIPLASDSTLAFSYSVNSSFGKLIEVIGGIGSTNSKVVYDDSPIKISPVTKQAYTPYISFSSGWSIYAYERNTNKWNMTKLGVDLQNVNPKDIFMFARYSSFYLIDDTNFIEITKDNYESIKKKYSLENALDWKTQFKKQYSFPSCTK